MQTQTPTFDADLIRRYDRSGPRYTSYPTALQFTETFGVSHYQTAAAASNFCTPARPLSVYVHVPFCSSPCFYCGCTKVITRNHDKAEAYLFRLHREIGMQGQLFERSRRLEQLHFGGGTPTFLETHELAGVLQQIDQHFGLDGAADREYSIELDPRTVTETSLHDLAAMGFNRCSLGVQDFDPAVQQAVNRVQSVADTLHLIDAARREGFNAVSVDLIYGLPRQSLHGFGKTLDTVIAARPNRFAVYSYAHMPQIFKAQKQIRTQDLATPETRLQLLGLTIEKLTAAGYVYIGMDHFALPDDELVTAQAKGSLQRNFQGYSTRGYCDMIGLGVSSIGRIGNAYAQNHKTLPEYYDAIDRGQLPVQRGLIMSDDDLIRRDVIQQIMCYGSIDFAATAVRHSIDFSTYFAAELRALTMLVADGLAQFDDTGLRVLPAGRLLLRHLAMVFDSHLPSPATAVQRYSKAI
jgi:oxygen-independent coproporphyrinogen-3 oxidase